MTASSGKSTGIMIHSLPEAARGLMIDLVGRVYALEYRLRQEMNLCVERVYVNDEEFFECISAIRSDPSENVCPSLEVGGFVLIPCAGVKRGFFAVELESA